MITTLNPNALIAWEMNPRKRIDTKSLQPLIDSMRSVGWFGAIMVRPVEEDRYQVLAGERRWRAACAVGLEGIACEVREMTDKEAIELAVIENRDREDLDIIEEAGGYQAMVELGWTVKEIASRSGKSEASIYGMLDLCDLAEDVQDALRDKLITAETARGLGRIEDDAERSEALQRIVKPRLQDHPLNAKQAMTLIQREYLDPQKRQKEWEKRMKWLLKEHGADVEIKSVAEAGEITGWNSGYERCDERPAEYELAVHAREKDREMIPTWGELADKHGAKKVVVPDAEGNAVFYVEREPLVTAEMVLGETDPEACVFPLPGAGRHEQSMEAEKSREEQIAERRQSLEMAEEVQKNLVREMYAGLVEGGWTQESEQDVLAKLAGMLVTEDLMEGLEAIPEALGVDVEALGDGDPQVGLVRWIERVVAVDAVAGCAFLLTAYGVANVFPGGYGAVEKLEALEAAVEAEIREEGAEEPEDVEPPNLEHMQEDVKAVVKLLAGKSAKEKKHQWIDDLAKDWGVAGLRAVLLQGGEKIAPVFQHRIDNLIFDLESEAAEDAP